MIQLHNTFDNMKRSLRLNNGSRRTGLMQACRKLYQNWIVNQQVQVVKMTLIKFLIGVLSYNAKRNI